jgi:acetyl esterase/lipase
MSDPTSPRRSITRRPLAALALGLALAVTAACGSSSTGAASTSSPSSTASPTHGCASQARPTTVAYETIAGVDPNLTSLDVHAPASACGAPVVVWVHGGGYQTGDKANQMADKVRLFNGHGWILVSVNYRLTKPGDPTSAQYPDHFHDVAAAVAWVHRNIAGYGGDPARVALLGHSAGADIVSNVADNPAYLAQQGLDLKAITCAGPLDTEGFDKATAGARDPDGEKAQWKVALGNQADYLTSTSATLLVKPGIGIPPTIGVVRGTAQRRQVETDYLAALRSAGIATTSIDARSLSHQQVNQRIGAPGDTVMTAPLIDFLTTCFSS